MTRVLLTGMSGTGKSALVGELRRRGYRAHDADDGFSERRPDGRWGWRVDLVSELFARAEGGLLFFAGCSEKQTLFRWDLTVLLTAPEQVIVERLRTRQGNTYGRGEGELAVVLADLRTVEPLLRRAADLVVDTTMPLREVADLVVRCAAGDGLRSRPRSGSAANR